MKNKSWQVCAFLSLLFVILVAQASFAREHAVTVHGKVTDEEDNGLYDARVSFTNWTTHNEYSAHTDSSGNYSLQLEVTDTDVQDNRSLPQGFHLFQNYPNPFNPGTVITFRLFKTTKVILRIFNIKGEEVTVLADGFYPAGLSCARWDGTDSEGNSVAAGVYLYRLETDNYAQTKKMLFVDGGTKTTGNIRQNFASALFKSKALFSETYLIRVDKEGFLPFRDKNLVIHAEDTKIERNIILTKTKVPIPQISFYRNMASEGRLNITVTDTLTSLCPPDSITISLISSSGDSETVTLGPGLLLPRPEYISYGYSVALKDTTSFESNNGILEIDFQQDSLTGFFNRIHTSETVCFSSFFNDISQGFPQFRQDSIIGQTVSKYGKSDIIYIHISSIFAAKSAIIFLYTNLGDLEKEYLFWPPDLMALPPFNHFGGRFYTRTSKKAIKNNGVIEIKSSGDIIHAIYVYPSQYPNMGILEINSITYEP